MATLVDHLCISIQEICVTAQASAMASVMAMVSCGSGDSARTITITSVAGTSMGR